MYRCSEPVRRGELATDQELIMRLERIELLLERLVAPVAAEEARQLLTCSDEQRKAHNRAVLQRAKVRQRNLA